MECDLCCLLTLLLPPQVLILTLADLAALTHLVVSASNLNGKQVIKKTNGKLTFLVSLS